MDEEPLYREGQVLLQEKIGHTDRAEIILLRSVAAGGWQCAWRWLPGDWQTGLAYVGSNVRRKPHPDPEPVKASYIRWVLARTAGVNPVKDATT